MGKHDAAADKQSEKKAKKATKETKEKNNAPKPNSDLAPPDGATTKPAAPSPFAGFTWTETPAQKEPAPGQAKPSEQKKQKDSKKDQKQEKTQEPSSKKTENSQKKAETEDQPKKTEESKRAKKQKKQSAEESEAAPKVSQALFGTTYSAGDLSKSLFASSSASTENPLVSIFAKQNAFKPPVPAKVVLPKFIPKLDAEKSKEKEAKKKKKRSRENEEEKEDEDVEEEEDENDDVYRNEGVGVGEEGEEKGEAAEDDEEEDEAKDYEKDGGEDDPFDSYAMARRMMKKYLTEENGEEAEEEEEADEEAEEEDAEKEEAEEEKSNTIKKRPNETPQERLARTVFVGNLPLKIKRKAIRQLFAKYGKVESVRMRSIAIAKPMERRAGVLSQQFHPSRDSCNAYVVMDSSAEARDCLQLNNSEFHGKHIRVDLATRENNKTDYSRSRHSVFVGNVPWGAEEESLRRHFASAGEVTNVRIVRDKDTLMGKGFAYVEFKDLESLERAVELNGSKFENRELRVTYAKGKPVLSDAAKKSKGGKNSQKNDSHPKNSKKTFSSSPTKKKFEEKGSKKRSAPREEKKSPKNKTTNETKRKEESSKKKQKTSSSASFSSPASFEGRRAVEGVKPELLKLAAHAKAASMAKKLQKQKVAQQKKRKNVNRDRKSKKKGK